MTSKAERVAINPPSLPTPTGGADNPMYSWAIKRGNMIFLAGMSPYNKQKALVGDDVQTQARQCFANMKEILEAGGASMADVCQITVFTSETDLQKDVYPQLNPVIKEFFKGPPPARTTVGGVVMPRGSERLQISGIAVVG